MKQMTPAAVGRAFSNFLTKYFRFSNDADQKRTSGSFGFSPGLRTRSGNGSRLSGSRIRGSVPSLAGHLPRDSLDHRPQHYVLQLMARIDKPVA